MVPGLEAVVAGHLMMTVADPVKCRLPKAPQIEIVPKTSPVQYDFTKTVAELQGAGSDTISPYGRHVEPIVFGLHQGAMQVGYQVQFAGEVFNSLGLGCLFFDKVVVTIELNPVIYVAKELKPKTCAHNAVLEHERKHVKTDRLIANKYAREIGVAVQEAVNRAGAVGPYPISDLESIRQRMAEHIGSTVESMKLNLLEEQFRMQQAVDSKEEYESVSYKIHHTCGFDYKPIKSKSSLGSRR